MSTTLHSQAVTTWFDICSWRCRRAVRRAAAGFVPPASATRVDKSFPTFGTGTLLRGGRFGRLGKRPATGRHVRATLRSRTATTLRSYSTLVSFAEMACDTATEGEHRRWHARHSKCCAVGPVGFFPVPPWGV